MSSTKGGLKMSKAASDKLLEKVISRKLLVWLSACGLMGVGMLDSADWVMISALYIGGQSVIDAVAKMKGVA
jgi:hypothetical protein|tara:strand:- start:91 stop:306 length:216 start_codon:yes stop_codon:yes gene_type:complete